MERFRINCDPEFGNSLGRAIRLPMGWLIRGQDNILSPVNPCLVFAPDENHQWDPSNTQWEGVGERRRHGYSYLESELAKTGVHVPHRVYYELYRTRLPHGWLILDGLPTQGIRRDLEYVPDPDHRWQLE